MAKTAAQRQADFRKSHGNKFKRLDVLLPTELFNELHGNAERQGVTKAQYIDGLLHGNSSIIKKPSITPKPLIKKALPDNKQVSVINVLASFLPDGINNTNDMRSALSDGYRKASGINHNLKANDVQGLNEYLGALDADEIKQLIAIKKQEISDKAKAKRLNK
ncbi:MAG: hypothetical protein K9L22_06645 [Methylococcaceae bacterium]|nr:hypothetical protein [Methylococcaceae bacterium]